MAADHTHTRSRDPIGHWHAPRVTCNPTTTSGTRAEGAARAAVDALQPAARGAHPRKPGRTRTQAPTSREPVGHATRVHLTVTGVSTTLAVAACRAVVRCGGRRAVKSSAGWGRHTAKSSSGGTTEPQRRHSRGASPAPSKGPPRVARSTFTRDVCPPARAAQRLLHARSSSTAPGPKALQERRDLP